MNKLKQNIAWTFLDYWRGKEFKGEWPTFPELLKIQSYRFAKRPCFTVIEDKKITLTYQEVYEKVCKLTDWFIENGLKKGDHVCLAGKNSPEWAVTYLAILQASGVVIPIADSLHEAETINIIKASDSKFAVLDDEKIPYVKKNFPKMTIRNLNPTDSKNYVYNLEAKKAVKQNEPATENDLALIMFTSGTTGIPKGVMLTHKNIIADGYIAQTNLIINEFDIFYALLPIHHAYTMQAAFICPLEVGAEIVFGKTMAVSKLMKELHDGKITIMLGVPLLYNKLLAGIRKGIKEKGFIVAGLMAFLRGVSFTCKKLFKINIGKKIFKPVLQKANIYTLRVAICGGGPLAPSVFKQYQAMGLDFIQGYGLTETSPIIALNPVEHFKLDSVGRDFSPYEEIKIINADSTKDEHPVGEIAVKGPMVMQGYYKMPKETAEMFTDDGFLKTGDLGWMDDEHYIRLCGRAKNLIVTSGGKNVYPEEIEDAFQLCDDINQITCRGYYTDEEKTAEEIEVLIYASDDLYKRLGLERNPETMQPEVYEEIKKNVSKINKTLQSYEQISKITMLKEPLEMTPSNKVKRNFTAKTYDI
ncbi:MAG: AMP-binding protein [Treponema sp.]|nr:AMP-binding protein [Treponema sp.]